MASAGTYLSLGLAALQRLIVLLSLLFSFLHFLVLLS